MIEFLSKLGTVYMGLQVAIPVVATAAIIAGYGVYAICKGISNTVKGAANAISDSIDNANDRKSVARAFNAVSKEPDLLHWFRQLSRIEQGATMRLWVHAACDAKGNFEEQQVQKILPCLHSYMPQLGFTQDSDIAIHVLQMMKRHAAAIDPAVTAAVTDQIFANLDPGLGIVSEDSIRVVSRIPKDFASLMTPEHVDACRNFMISALDDQGLRPSLNTLPLRMKALEALALPRYAHGGERATAALSLEQGGYSAAQRAEIGRKAGQIISTINGLVQEGHDRFHLPQGRQAVLEFIKEVEKALPEAAPAQNAYAGKPKPGNGARPPFGRAA